MTSAHQHAKTYIKNLVDSLSLGAVDKVPILAEALRDCWEAGKSVYLCGNGGSAANAIHLANDFIFGVGRINRTGGLKVEALSANPAVLTSLANDIGYEEIFAEQIRVKGLAGDMLVVLSGSGNSKNVIKALEIGNSIGMKTFAILGYSGGLCKNLAQNPIHFQIDDMQIAEDLQLVVGHICMQWLYENPIDRKVD